MSISSSDIPSLEPLQSPQPLFAPTNKTGSFVFRAVTWFKGEGQSDTVIFWRQVAAVALALLLALSLIGIPFLIEGIHLWNSPNKTSIDSELSSYTTTEESNPKQTEESKEEASQKLFSLTDLEKFYGPIKTFPQLNFHAQPAEPYVPASESGWVLMTKELISGYKNKSFTDQQTLLKESFEPIVVGGFTPFGLQVTCQNPSPDDIGLVSVWKY